jgi:hypothetical protein
VPTGEIYKWRVEKRLPSSWLIGVLLAKMASYIYKLTLMTTEGGELGFLFLIVGLCASRNSLFQAISGLN